MLILICGILVTLLFLLDRLAAKVQGRKGAVPFWFVILVWFFYLIRMNIGVSLPFGL